MFLKLRYLRFLDCSKSRDICFHTEATFEFLVPARTYTKDRKAACNLVVTACLVFWVDVFSIFFGGNLLVKFLDSTCKILPDSICII